MRARIVAFAVAVATGAAFVACNAVLGIDKASLEPDAGSGTDGGSTAFVAIDDCDAYCSDITTSCIPSSADKEYLSTDVCKTMCNDRLTSELFGFVDEPQLNDSVDLNAAMPTSDTLFCRIWHSHVALTEPDVHCRHAGPLGADTCGSNPCQDFCALAVDLCNPPDAAPAYASVSECMNACLPDAGGYSGFVYNTTGSPDLASAGNTLNCRIYHLENYLFTGDPTHCTHITQKSTPDTCGDPVSADAGTD
jgi:hypothetical protein